MASLLTGAPPEVHGLRSDRFHLPRAAGPTDPLPRVLAAAGLPTSTFMRRLPLVFLGVADRIARHIGVAAPTFAGRTATEILFTASAALTEQERGLILLHWPDCDHAGHAHGWMSDPYARAARRLDLALGLLATCAEVGRDPARCSSRSPTTAAAASTRATTTATTRSTAPSRYCSPATRWRATSSTGRRSSTCRPPCSGRSACRSRRATPGGRCGRPSRRRRWRSDSAEPCSHRHRHQTVTVGGRAPASLRYIVRRWNTGTCTPTSTASVCA